MLKRNPKIGDFRKQKDIMNIVRELAMDHQRLQSLKKAYLTSFINIVARMKIDDSDVWSSLTAYLEQLSDTEDLAKHQNIQFYSKELANRVFALNYINERNPDLDFTTLFRRYEDVL